MLRNHDDLAHFENRNPRCKYTHMSAASQKNSDRYLLKLRFVRNKRPAGRPASQPAGRPDTSTHFRIVLSLSLYWIIDPI